MKALARLLWASAAFKTSFVAAKALVYTSESSSRQAPVEPPSISPHTARLLLAHRLGLSQYHSIQDADDSIVGILNTYGGEKQQIFGPEETFKGAEKLLLIVEGVDEDVFGQPVAPAFEIDPQPSSSQNLELAIDLLNQDRDTKQKGQNPCYFAIPGHSSLQGGVSSLCMGSRDCGAWYNSLNHDAGGELRTPTLSVFEDGREIHSPGSDSQTTILHISSLEGLSPKDGDRYLTHLSEIRTFIGGLLHNSRSISYTIVLMPLAPKNSKRSATSLYGSYHKPLQIRQQQPEEPLSAPSSASSPSEVIPLQASASPLPRGILPICHPTLQSCIASTNNCSGHGTAYKKSSGAIDCFACKCSKTVLTDDEGRVKTVYWGGPACQKKDISVPFFLLATLSITLVGVVTWGVGLMASIGQEELPSVIGAGVAGPRAQK